jgi:hypothetical protein
MNFFCDKKCCGLSKKTSIEEKKKVKRIYDKRYRSKNLDRIRQNKKEYFKKDYLANLEKYRQIRKEKYKKHLQYLNTSKYKKWKREYDKKYLAKKYFGKYWECAILLNELENFLLNNAPEGMHFRMGITNKTQKRKRLWQRTIKKQTNLQQQT